MFKKWGSTIIILTAVIIQTTLLRNFSIADARPDIALIFLIFFANFEGKMRGQVIGFCSGFLEDLLSLSPLGFHSFLKTIIGFLYGITKGKIFIDPILMPAILTGIGTLLKMVFGAVLLAVFVNPVIAANVFSVQMWIEVGFNMLLAPFLFGFMKIFKAYRIRQDGF